MPTQLFRKGVSGNPRGRPKGGADLRELLVQRYGKDAAGLVDRLEELSQHRNAKVAQEAIRLLLAYHSGRPRQAIDVTTGGSERMFILAPGARVDVGYPLPVTFDLEVHSPAVSRPAIEGSGQTPVDGWPSRRRLQGVVSERGGQAELEQEEE